LLRPADRQSPFAPDVIESVKWNILLGELGAKRAREITARFEIFMRQLGGAPADFCVGISREPLLRGWSGHAVDLKDGNYVVSKTDSAEMAYLIEKHFAEIVGTDVAVVSAGGDSIYVYAYRKIWHTASDDQIPLPS
jgi:hypothetical protein